MMLMLTTISLKTSLKSLKLAKTEVEELTSYRKNPDKLKKRARIQVSTEKANKQLGFMHACLIEVKGKFIMIAGASGIGKSSLSSRMVDKFSGSILANDWVAVEKEGAVFYASDLNYRDSTLHSRVELSGVIFLQKIDTESRSAYSPGKGELTGILKEVFDDMSAKESQILSNFWHENSHLLDLCVTLPRYNLKVDESSAIIEKEISNYLNIFGNSSKNITVGIIGVGEVGSLLAYRLTQLKYVNRVLLHDNNKDRTYGLSVDINQAQSIHHTEASCEPQISKMAQSCDVLFFCFRDSGLSTSRNLDPYSERQARISHADIVKNYAKTITENPFKGTVFVVSNPSDILAHKLYIEASKGSYPLLTNQVYGLGLELDRCRAEEAAKELGINPDSIELFGGHSTELITTVNGKNNQELLRKTEEGSTKVRAYSKRTVYAPVESIVKNLDCFLNNRSSHLTVMQSNSFFGGKVDFNNGSPSRILIDNTELKHIYEKHMKTL